MNRTKKFTRRIEDFTCEQCGHSQQGNGYTNHCSACLTSKHVDRNPGDRLGVCQGLMIPTDIQVLRKEWIVVQRCERCGEVKKNRLSPEDLPAARAFLDRMR